MVSFDAIEAVVSIDLPNPILGDSDTINLKTKFDFSMSKVVHSTLKTEHSHKFTLRFSNLSTAKMSEFKTFLENARGNLFNYYHYDTRIFSPCLILGDTFEFTHEGQNECEEVWGIQIEVEGYEFVE
jgi:hypothetical protein